MKKLKNKRGETLIEALAAILIFALSTVVLYSLVTSSARLNMQARQADKDFQQQLAAAEQAQSKDKIGSGTVKVTFSSQDLGSVTVSVYGEEDGLYAYYPD